MNRKSVGGGGRRGLKVAIQLVLLALLGGLAYRGTLYAWAWRHKDSATPEGTTKVVLAIPPDELDLGRVWETPSREHVVHVTNVSDMPIAIARFEKSCNCLGIVPSEGMTLGPHETTALTLKLALLSRANPTATFADELFVVRFDARYSGGEQANAVADWQLKALIRPTIRVTPGLLSLGSKSKRQAVEAAFQVRANAEIESIGGKAPPGWELDIRRDASAEPAGGFRGVLRQQAVVGVGPISGTIHLRPVSRDGSRLPTKDLPIAGEIVEDVAAHPRDVHLGRKPIGTSAAETIRLASLTGRAFRVTNVISKSADVKVSQLPGPDDGWVYSLRVQVAQPGEQVASAEFTIWDDQGKEFTVSIPVRYHGVQEP